MSAGLALACAAIAATAFAADGSNVRGFPFTRRYSLEEIGHAARGARLDFDAFGRLALIHDGLYTVLNDTAWIDLVDRSAPGRIRMSNVVRGADGRDYYGGLGSWGLVERGIDGKLRPVSLAPATLPHWAQANTFDRMLVEPAGVFFISSGGFAYWNAATRENTFFELAGLTSVFRHRDRILVSSHSRPLQEVDLAHDTLRAWTGTAFGGGAALIAEPLDEEHTLLHLNGGRLVVFDGQGVTPWLPQERHNLTGAISAVRRLVDGGVAVAITGRGLFLVSPTGELTLALTTPEYHRITRLAAREAGVLWLAVEDGVEKVLYGHPFTTFGQRLGLPLSWPVPLRWGDRFLVLSSGKLYEARSDTPGGPSHFEPIAAPAAAGAAARGDQLLIGTRNAVLAAGPDGRFERIISFPNASRLALVGDDLCFVIGETEIAALRWSDGRWAECAPRIPAIGRPAVVHAARRSAWIEFGGNQVARLALREGRLQLRAFEDWTWHAALWVNVSIVDDIAILNGAGGNWRFFDERTETFVAAPQLERLHDRSPYEISRIHKDDTGTLWATYRNGVIRFTPRAGGDYEMDATTFHLIYDLYPFVHLLPGGEIWFTAENSLYQVDRSRPAPTPQPLQPKIVSVTDERTNVELAGEPAAAREPLRLPYAENTLAFRLCSESYAWRRPPVYEYRLNEAGRWTPLEAGSLLRFANLPEDKYRLQVRLADRPGPLRPPLDFAFEVLPPWHRTWPAFLTFGASAGLLFVGVVRWITVHSRRRNLVLEQLVRDRTRQLERTMEQLNDETRTAATLAERNRLAAEIHDSMQQGLNGTILQLDATLLLPSITGALRSRLEVVRNMISSMRLEVQHAVWDMETPLLNDTELGEALHRLTAWINAGSATIDVSTTGEPRVLSPAERHHLLRIAQEATNNAVRHARARHIAIRLHYAGDAVTLTITDDGVGFPAEHVLNKSAGHFGLRGIRGRAKKIGGQLNIASVPGCGTSIEIVVALAPSPHAAISETRPA